MGRFVLATIVAVRGGGGEPSNDDAEIFLFSQACFTSARGGAGGGDWVSDSDYVGGRQRCRRAWDAENFLWKLLHVMRRAIFIDFKEYF